MNKRPTRLKNLTLRPEKVGRSADIFFSCFQCADYLEFLSSMATKYELPEKVNEKCLRTLGSEVEMKTFKTNDVPEGEAMVKIACVGGYTGGFRTKGVFIDDYRQVQPDLKSIKGPLIGVAFHLKTIKWQRRVAEEPVLARLQFWEIGEHASFAEMFKPCLKFSDGALVFWGTCVPSSLEQATKWRQVVRDSSPSIPCFLITDNVTMRDQEPLQWIGPGKTFESEVALDQFCKDHGFLDHFEIKSRDWESGEKSVFGEAVNCLLKIIFNNEPKEVNVIR